ncbi:hypothetical protein AB205_0131100 [Aquarana catesbeiana]|uniref:Uncharacterized protein n=1 Tax=Aquarana catesbeiana TaxID=8400 RepID=A0A2G9SBD0_AQUCT|nr:hypothetical protein AB205_0131100 [Aquarana catesbeiana]
MHSVPIFQFFADYVQHFWGLIGVSHAQLSFAKPLNPSHCLHFSGEGWKLIVLTSNAKVDLLFKEAADRVVNVSDGLKLRPPTIYNVSRTPNQRLYISWNTSHVNESLVYEVAYRMSTNENEEYIRYQQSVYM